MKKNLFFLLIFFSSIAYGQAPNQINYQGIARNSVGNVIPNKNISVRLSVHDGSANGVIVYREIRNVKTSSFGLFNIAIGGGGAFSTTGTVAGINWGSGAKFLQVEIDPLGGSNFVDLGAAQLLSVPYALFSANSTIASPAGPAGGDLNGTYPDPTIKANAVTTTKLADNSVTNSKIADGAVTSSKLAAGVIPTSLPPSGSAGGDLSGNYPNPSVDKIKGINVNNTVPATGQVLKFDGTQWSPSNDNVGSGAPSGPAGGDLSGAYPDPSIKDNAVITSKILDGSVTSSKLAAGVIPTTLPPSGTAGGDLTGTYPNPTLKDNAVTTTKILDASVTSSKLAPGVIPTTLPPSGTAGGDLTGTYPNPTIIDNAITTSKILDASVTSSKLAAGVIPTTLPPSGTAGGDLAGTYPDPSIKDNAVTTTKILDASVTSSKLAPGVIPTTLPPSGTAGGDLFGNYPNPTVNKIQTIGVSNVAPATGEVLKFDGTQWAPATDIGAGGSFPIGPAGGDLSGTYPNPTIAFGAVTSTKIANASVSTSKIEDLAVTTNKLADLSVTTPKLADASVTLAKIAPGVIPTSLPPSGGAGGDLSGSYPNPTVNKVLGIPVITTGGSVGQVLKFNGTQWAPANDNMGGGGSPSGPAGGDLSGNYPNPTVSKILGISVNNTGLAAGQILKYNGTQWAPAADNTGGTPSGAAGGDLSGNYPNPTVSKILGISVNNTGLAAGQVLKYNGTQWAPAADNTGGTPSGAAGGDLTGTYPNPTIANGVISTSKLIDGSVTLVKIAPGVIPTSLPPNGAAGGDLTGSTYPNPILSKIQGVNVTATGASAGQVLKFDGTQWIPGTDDIGSGGGSPTGPAGGDLTGTYPNPTIADGVISTSKLIDGSVTAAKIAPGVIPTSLPPNGAAGGDLTGSTYPNPTISKIQGVAVTATGASAGQVLKFNGTTWVPGTDDVGSGGGSPTGPAGGDLSGSYPNPTVSKILGIPVDNTGLVSGQILKYNGTQWAPAADNGGTPSGTAGGDLSGTYPNPTVSKIQTVAVSNTAPTTGDVLKYNGTQWAPAAGTASGAAGGDLSGSYPNPTVNKIQTIAVSNTAPTSGQVLKFNGTSWAPAADNTGSLTLPFAQTINSAQSGIAITNQGTGAGLEGINTVNGIGVKGTSFSSDGLKGISTSGPGVHGVSTGSDGVHGESMNGTGVYGNSSTGNAGMFEIVNASNGTDALSATTEGIGAGVNGSSQLGSGVVGNSFSSDPTNAGVYAISQGAAASLIADSYAGGNPAVFKNMGTNVARIDANGKGYFNGNIQTSGADVAEFFEVEGQRKTYEPGDVLIISQSSDRKVERSQKPYSTLVAGVYATRPGLMLTERNAVEDKLDDMVPMGVIGVIPTKVCLEGGAIKRGDLLVTSSIPGVAMKADIEKVKPGQVIGKALQEFNGEGTGKINVLVSIK